MSELIVGGWRVELQTSLRSEAKVAYTQQYHEGQLCSVSDVRQHTRCDGIVITRRDQAVAIHTADCLPLLITTFEEACLLHISRKTLLTELLPQALQRLQRNQITGLFFGPHICQRHFVFEYEGDEIIAFKKKFPAACLAVPGGTALSLMIATKQLLMPQLPSDVKILMDGRCTYEVATLPSYRRWLEQGKPGELPHLFTIVSRN